jgi:hypothetical protein
VNEYWTMKGVKMAVIEAYLNYCTILTLSSMRVTGYTHTRKLRIPALLKTKLKFKASA